MSAAAVARLDTAAIFAPVPAVPWICEGIELAPGAPTLLAGLGFAGKTPLAQDLAIAIASGGNAWDAFPCTRGRVVHLDYEQGDRLTRERYQRIARGRRLTEADLDGHLSAVIFPKGYIDGDGAEDWLCKEFDGATLAIIDSFRAASPRTDENASVARVPLDMLGRVSARTGCAALLIHHARKPAAEETGPDRHAVRGSSAIFDACQAVLVATPAVEERTNKEGKVTRDGQPPQIIIAKARLSGRTYAEPMRFAIEDVQIGDDPRAGLSVSVTLPVERETLAERLCWALKAAKAPKTRRRLRDDLHCSQAALDGAIASLGTRVRIVPIDVRGKPAEGLSLAA